MLTAVLTIASTTASPVFVPSNFFNPMTARTNPQSAASGWVYSASQ